MGPLKNIRTTLVQTLVAISLLVTARPSAADVVTDWNALTVGDLFERIRVSMPPSNPSSVTAKEKAEITAHILKNAGFPAGAAELAAQTEPLKAIKFEATKPGR